MTQRGPSDRLLLWVAALAILASACSPRDMWAPDEPRYGQIAREMLEGGHWLVPYVNGQPYAEKPPLFWWVVAGVSAPFGGVSTLLTRLVAALFAVGALLAVARLARRWFDAPGVAGTAAVLFAGNVLVAWNASRAGLDLPLTCALLWAVERGGAWARGGGWRAALAFGLLWAAAILIKGPLGFLLPPAILAGEMLGLRRAPRLGDPGWWLAPLAMAGACLAWLLPAVAAGGEAYSDRLLGQIAGRVSGAEGGHRRPPYYYLLCGTLFSLPVLGHLAAGAFVALRSRAAEGPARAGLKAALVGGPLLFLLLSAIATKREVYLIPAMPFFALAAAWALHRGLLPGWMRHAARLFALVLGGAALFALAAPFVSRAILNERFETAPPAAPWWLWVVLPAAAALLGWAAWRAWRARGEPATQLRAAAVPYFAALVVISAGCMPALDPYKSWRPLAQAAEASAAGGAIYHAGFHQGPNLLWELDRQVTPPLPDAAAVIAAFAPGRPRAAVVAPLGWWEAQRAAGEKDPALAAALATLHEDWRSLSVRRPMLVLSNAPR